MYIYASNENSSGAKELGNALDAPRIKHEGSKFVGRADKIVINWGSNVLPAEILKCRVINSPEAITIASNKLNFFRSLSDDIRTPEFTTDRGFAQEWVNTGSTVVCRTVLNGSSGRGIIFVEPRGQVPEAPLYTKYVKKKDEYRIHFVGQNLIDTQRKALRPEINRHDVDWRIRNLQGGFIFVRNNINPPDDVFEQARRVAANTNLDFGAIDLIYNESENRAYVLEVNTAPGLVGTTVTNYANALRQYGA